MRDVTDKNGPLRRLPRCKWEKAKAEAEARGDPAGARAAEQALAELPEVSPMDGLRANAELVNRLTVQRWIGMKVAQERGASLDQIGQELGVLASRPGNSCRGSPSTRVRCSRGSDPPTCRGRCALGAPQRKIAEHEGQPAPADPHWDDFIAGHGVGDVLDGLVTGVVPFGAFIEVAEGVGGLLRKPASWTPPAKGAAISVRIAAIDAENRRMRFEPA